MKVLFVFATMFIAVAGCSSGSDDSNDVLDDMTGIQDVEPSLPPATAADLTAVVATRYNSDTNYDYWQCDYTSGRSYILLPLPGTVENDIQRGFELTELGGQRFPTVWSATSANSLLIEYQETGQAFDFTDLVFENVNTVRIGSGPNAPQDCTRQTFSSTTPDTIDSLAGPATEPPGLAAMYGIIVFRLLPSGFFGPTDDAILAFEDGSYTEDITGVMRDGIAASRANRPNDWGEWRGSAGSLELREAGESEFDETSGSWLVEPGGTDERINGCYSAVGGVGPLGDDGIGNVNFSTVCFFTDGRFTHDRTLWAQSPSVDLTSSNGTSWGRYRIDGNAIKFVYDSGQITPAAFGFSNREAGAVTSIYLDDDLHID